MGFVGFGAPESAIGPMQYNQQPTDLGSYNNVTPPPNTTSVSVSVPDVLAGPNGFNLPGSAAQNVVTDPNVGLSGGGSPSFGTGALMPSLSGGSMGGDMGGLNGAC